MDNENLIVFGDSVKMRGNDIVSGHLVLFGDKNQTDATRQRDYFTPDTDFGLDLTTKSRVLYQHGFDEHWGKTSLGIGEMKVDEIGVWIEAQLKKRQDYEEEIGEVKFTQMLDATKSLIEKEKLGWSSGTGVHLVERERQDNGAHWIKRWPLGLDASLTPNPAEPRTFANLKSLDIKSSGLSMQSKADILQRAIRAKIGTEKDDEYCWCYISDLFDTTVVWQAEGGTYEATYSIDGITATIGTPKQVMRLVSYKPIGTDSAKSLVQTERDFEKFLRDAGFAKDAALTITSAGYKALSRRDADEATQAEIEAERQAAERARALHFRHLMLKHDALKAS